MAKYNTSKAAPTPVASPVRDTAAQKSEEGATVQVSYARQDDYLHVLTVTEYTSARVIVSRRTPEKRGVSSIVRFDGDRVLWLLKSERDLNGPLVVRRAAKAKLYAIGAVNYGKVPAHFVQVEPQQNDPPEPLAPGRYYIFSVERGSGSTSYHVVKAQSDGKLVGYNAEPRAGSSFELCCDLPSDFAPPEENPEAQTPSGEQPTAVVEPPGRAAAQPEPLPPASEPGSQPPVPY